MNPTLRRILRFSWLVLRTPLQWIACGVFFVSLIAGYIWAKSIAMLLIAVISLVVAAILAYNLCVWIRKQWTLSADPHADGDPKNLPYVS